MFAVNVSIHGSCVYLARSLCPAQIFPGLLDVEHGRNACSDVDLAEQQYQRNQQRNRKCETVQGLGTTCVSEGEARHFTKKRSGRGMACVNNNTCPHKRRCIQDRVNRKHSTRTSGGAKHDCKGRQLASITCIGYLPRFSEKAAKKCSIPTDAKRNYESAWTSKTSTKRSTK